MAMVGSTFTACSTDAAVRPATQSGSPTGSAEAASSTADGSPTTSAATAPGGSTTAASTTPTTNSTTSTTPNSTTTGSSATTTATASSTAVATTTDPTVVTTIAGPPRPGEAGLGDELFPTAGNTGYDVADYDIALNWDPTAKHLDGHETISATATQALTSFDLDLLGLDVSEIRIDDAPALFQRFDTKLIISPTRPIAAGAKFTTTVAYAGSPTVGPAAGGWVDWGTYVAVAGEPASPNWHPVNEHPSDKATYTVRLTVPTGTTAVANGELAGQSTADGLTTSTYRMDQPMASYLATILIGNFTVVEGRTTTSGVKVRHVIENSLVEPGTQLFAPTSDIIEVFERLFGPYPFKTYGAALIPATLGFAIETQTLSVFSGDFADGLNDGAVAHELAHQWFGDAVSLTRWHDTWLNEGFATYAEALWDESQDPKFDFHAWIARTAADAGGPDAPSPARPKGPDSIFDPAIYKRGALVLHALRLAVGDANFFQILKSWVDRFGGENATTADFIALSKEVSVQDLDQLFQDWLFADQMPASLDGVDLTKTGG